MFWPTSMEAESIEKLGQIADALDSSLYITKLDIKDVTKLDALIKAIQTNRDAIVQIVIAESGENPWEDMPLEG